MNDIDREQWQIQVSNLADKLLDFEIKEGMTFSEGLCDWAMNEALRRIEQQIQKA